VSYSITTKTAATAKKPLAGEVSTKKRGDAAEELALQFLQRKGLILVFRNFATPGRGGGEIDLIMRDVDSTLVFIEVRQRKSASHGGAAASVGWVKQQRIIFTARHYLARLTRMPPCRFDVVCVHGSAPDQTIDWIRSAFDAS
jgi:putative endonuclease